MREDQRDMVLRLLAAAPAGLSAPELARQLKPRVSQPTLWRLLDELRHSGRVIVQGRARATRYYSSDRTDVASLRSRRLHEVVARKIARDPSLAGEARERLRRLRQVNPHGRVYHDRWQELLDGPVPRLLRVMTEDSETSEALRKESPLTTLVTSDERRRVFETTRAG